MQTRLFVLDRHSRAVYYEIKPRWNKCGYYTGSRTDRTWCASYSIVLCYFSCLIQNCSSYVNIAGIAVDWLNGKLYWTDVQTRWIGVLDLNTRFYKMLITTEADANPREIVLDPTTRYII